MIEYPLVIILALLLLAFGMFSKLSERSVISAPMVFVTAGLLLSYFSFGAFGGGKYARSVEILAELTLILVLFNDASTLDRKALRKDRKIPLRLLFIGLPITMLAGFGLAYVFWPEIELWQLALMALILSPTDAALGLAVVTSPKIPLRIRQSINAESGLNDGLALPPILICVAMLSANEYSSAGMSYWGIFALKQFILGPLVGAIVGRFGGRMVEYMSQKGFMNSTFQQIATLSLAIIAFVFAEMTEGNGFIAAFCAGLFLGIETKEIRHRMHSFGEATSQLLILIIFFLMGMILVPLSFPYWNWKMLVYAIASLSVIRILPVMLSLTGLNLNWRTTAFIGWFGPRGIASVLYLIMANIEIGIPEIAEVMAVVSLTVLISVFAHGATAGPLSSLYGRWMEKNHRVDI